MNQRIPQLAQIEITRFSKKGHGIGINLDLTKEISQREVEVPFTIPGDIVKVLLQKKRRGLEFFQQEEITTPSPLRIQPRCVHFGKCGGCRLQQLRYEEQLKIKQTHIETLFQPLMQTGTILYPIIACDPPWHYRNKMEFSFSQDAAGKHYLGLIIDGSRGKVLNLTECHLTNPWFTETLRVVRSWWVESKITAYHPHKNTGSLRTLTVREGISTGDRLVMLTVSGNPDFALKRHELDSFVAFLRDAIEPTDPNCTLSIFLRIQQAVKGQPTNFFEMQLYGPDHIREILNVSPVAEYPPIKLEFLISPSAFFQPNTRQAERLYSRALQLLEIPKDSIIYDLYCGTGTLGICAAQGAKRVIGIEISEESSLDARTNATKNELYHVDIRTGSVDLVLNTLLQDINVNKPTVVMVDPPRIGLDPVTLQHLKQIKAPKLLYISCNPTSQAANIKELQEMGYTLKALQPVDQFPHTNHIENIAILEIEI